MVRIFANTIGEYSNHYAILYIYIYRHMHRDILKVRKLIQMPLISRCKNITMF